MKTDCGTASLALTTWPVHLDGHRAQPQESVSADLALGACPRTVVPIDIYSASGRGFGRIEATETFVNGAWLSPAVLIAAQQRALSAIAPCGHFRAASPARPLPPASVAQLLPAVQAPWGSIALGGVTQDVSSCVAHALHSMPFTPLPAARAQALTMAEAPLAFWLPFGLVASLWAAAGFFGDRLWTRFRGPQHDEESGMTVRPPRGRAARRA